MANKDGLANTSDIKFNIVQQTNTHFANQSAKYTAHCPIIDNVGKRTNYIWSRTCAVDRTAKCENTWEGPDSCPLVPA